MNLETLVAYAVGLLSTLVCAVCFYLLGMAHGLARAKREASDE